MLTILILSAFSTYVLISPPPSLALILDLMDLPYTARLTLLGVVVANVVCSLLLERWNLVGRAVAVVQRWWRHSHSKKRVRDGKAYKAIEGGTRL